MPDSGPETSSASCPDTPFRAYAPALETRQNDFKFAATGPIPVHGVTAANAPAAPGDLSFGEYVLLPEALELYGAPTESDSSCLLLEFQEAFSGEATRRDLTNFVRANHNGRPRGFRYWNRLAGSIWKTYQGLQRGKERTQKAHDGELKRLVISAKRAGKEVKRSALRRVAKNESDRLALPAAKMRTRAKWLLDRADKKAADSRALAERAESLRAEAEALEANARRFEFEVGEHTTPH
jgi:hypothetical protein